MLCDDILSLEIFSRCDSLTLKRLSLVNTKFRRLCSHEQLFEKHFNYHGKIHEKQSFMSWFNYFKYVYTGKWIPVHYQGEIIKKILYNPDRSDECIKQIRKDLGDKTFNFAFIDRNHAPTHILNGKRLTHIISGIFDDRIERICIFKTRPGYDRNLDSFIKHELLSSKSCQIYALCEGDNYSIIYDRDKDSEGNPVYTKNKLSYINSAVIVMTLYRLNFPVSMTGKARTGSTDIKHSFRNYQGDYYKIRDIIHTLKFRRFYHYFRKHTVEQLRTLLLQELLKINHVF